MNPKRPAEEPFRDALRELLCKHEEFTTAFGGPNYAAYARVLPSTSYKRLRDVLAGERRLTWQVIEECADVLRVEPEHFVEYGPLKAQHQFTPDEIGWEQALENLRCWVNRGR